jgi:hypothetical protein
MPHRLGASRLLLNRYSTERSVGEGRLFDDFNRDISIGTHPVKADCGRRGSAVAEVFGVEVGPGLLPAALGREDHALPCKLEALAAAYIPAGDHFIDAHHIGARILESLAVFRTGASRQLFNAAREHVYVSPIGMGLGPFTITPKYLEEAREIARDRVALAGVRLSNLLNSSLK